MTNTQRWLRGVGAGLLVLASMVLLCDYWVLQAARGRTFDRVTATPERSVALVLGCGKVLADGRQNLFFNYRIRAAADLYKAGKVKAILVSGDNHTQAYDESTDMKEALVAAGVPGEKITCDYAGFRTLDSVVRAKKIFGLNEVLVVSQRFHNERTLYLAKCYGLDAVAFNAQDVPAGWALKTHAREFIARVKAVLDVHILGTQPKFLGRPEKVQGL